MGKARPEELKCKLKKKKVVIKKKFFIKIKMIKQKWVVKS